MIEEDFQHQLKALYQPPKNEFTYVNVPKMKYMVIDGQGDPGQNGMDAAIKWLYSIAHFLVPLAKERMGAYSDEPEHPFRRKPNTFPTSSIAR